MVSEDVRSFIAIELPQEIKQSLGQLQSQLGSAKSVARWVAPDSIHLTLKFLGGVSASSIPDITRVMEEAVFGIPPFRLRVHGTGVFPDERRVRVVWVGVDGDTDKLMEIQKELESGLERLGFPKESRPFTAHLTLARIRDEASAAERQAIGQSVIAASFDGGEFTVDSISLMKSQLTRQGAIYSRLASGPLTEG